MRDKNGIKTRAKAQLDIKWDEYSDGIKLVAMVIKSQIRHGTGNLNHELAKAFRQLGRDIIDSIVDEL
ncbi:hypothetical protein OAU50_01060 [Planctomycetota bacterium]|nr:hypothetical protein [Planctomycetota bacterium]